MKTKLTALTTSSVILLVAFTAMFAKTTIVSGQTAPENMALIPAGEFQMGDSFGEGYSNERPVHTVYVSAFYMDKYEVTKALWDEVYNWAINHGYGFEHPGFGKAADHPIHSIGWYDMVKWCNARSEKEGRVPSYYYSAEQKDVYRYDEVDIQNDCVKWNAGYRLPTEAEWEKAARGGLSGRRFPWGNTISHTQANYESSSNNAYDISPTRGFHPTFKDGDQPYTNPVGYFSPNGYGLYDMSGNIIEWCWDCWDADNVAYLNGYQTNPRGLSGYGRRIGRGGGWDGDGKYCRVTWRGSQWEGFWTIYVGLRTALSFESSWAKEFEKIPTPTQPVYSPAPQKQAGKDSLIVVTHGWMPDITWLDAMTNSISQYLLANGLNNWQVHAHKWVEKAQTPLPLGPEMTLNEAEREGKNLGKFIAGQKWNRVHLIAHSAGSALIQSACEAIKNESSDTTVHLTFLDAFIGLFYRGEHKYGKYADWSDSYFSRDSGTVLTEGQLDYAYNIDVTWLDSKKEPVKVYYSSPLGDVVQTCFQTVTSHDWPHQFYNKTIPPNSIFGSESFGFALSREGGNWDFATNSYKVGKSTLKVLGNSEPYCLPTTIPVGNGSPTDLSKLTVIKSSTGISEINGNSLKLRTDSPVWVAFAISMTNNANFVSFESGFESIGAQGLLTVYWGTNQIGSVDERVSPSGLRQYSFGFPINQSNGLHSLGFRLDPFSPATSSVLVTNVSLGSVGLREQFSLSFTGTKISGLPVLELQGQAGFNYSAETSTNLIDWKTIAALVNTNGIVRFVDSVSTNATTRFYRAVAP